MAQPKNPNFDILIVVITGVLIAAYAIYDYSVFITNSPELSNDEQRAAFQASLNIMSKKHFDFLLVMLGFLPNVALFSALVIGAFTKAQWLKNLEGLYFAIAIGSFAPILLTAPSIIVYVYDLFK